MSSTARLVLLLLGVALASCAVGPNYHTPEVGVPAQYAGLPTPTAPLQSPSATPPSNIDLEAWWRSLEDPELDSLIERAVKANPDVLIALDRLQAARVYQAALLGGLLPQVDASVSAGRGTGRDLTRGRAPQALTSADNTAGLRHLDEIGGFDAVWELDVFGKYRREIEVARYDTQAAAAARDAVLIAVIADVARSYTELRGLQVRDSVLHAAADVLRESLRIVRIRYERGITNELDVTLATRELASVEAQIPPLEARALSAQAGIATLLGRYPEELVHELDAKALIPTVPDPPAPGLPVELLKRRPDVRQAERQLAASTANIGVATASLFPRLVVTGASGFQRQALEGTPVLGEHIWSAGPSLYWPLLDFGALDAQVEIADYRTRALLVSYKRTVQNAVKDVDTTWGAYSADRGSLAKLGEALTASQRAVTLATERYERGLTDYLNVVDAERQESSIEEQYAAAQVALTDDFIALYRSLGGGWQRYQSLPPIHRPEPAIIAVFQRLLSRNSPLSE